MTNAELHGCAFPGWQCFHCGEIFETIGGAQDHFGADPSKKPGCMIKVSLGDERGLLMDWRKAEEELDRLRAENERLRALYLQNMPPAHCAAIIADIIDAAMNRDDEDMLGHETIGGES